MALGPLCHILKNKNNYSIFNLFSGASSYRLWTSGSFLGAQSVPRWCATGDPMNVTAFKWGTSAAAVPSTDVTKYLTGIVMDSQAPYLLNILATDSNNIYALCEEY
jgi:hypothetical protein